MLDLSSPICLSIFDVISFPGSSGGTTALRKPPDAAFSISTPAKSSLSRLSTYTQRHSSVTTGCVAAFAMIFQMFGGCDVFVTETGNEDANSKLI